MYMAIVLEVLLVHTCPYVHVHIFLVCGIVRDSSYMYS